MYLFITNGDGFTSVSKIDGLANGQGFRCYFFRVHSLIISIQHDASQSLIASNLFSTSYLIMPLLASLQFTPTAMAPVPAPPTTTLMAVPPVDPRPFRIYLPCPCSRPWWRWLRPLNLPRICLTFPRMYDQPHWADDPLDLVGIRLPLLTVTTTIRHPREVPVDIAVIARGHPSEHLLGTATSAIPGIEYLRIGKSQIATGGFEHESLWRKCRN